MTHSADEEWPVPFEFSVDSEREIITIIGRGDARLQDVLDAVQTVAAHARDHPRFSLLSDTRELAYEASVPDLLEIARAMFSRRELISRRLAIVVLPGVHEQVGKMLASMSAYVGMRVDVFHDVENAVFWLQRGQPPKE